jgi:hypothetical protein
MEPQMHANTRKSESGTTKNQEPGTKNQEMEPQVNASERNRKSVESVESVDMNPDGTANARK